MNMSSNLTNDANSFPGEKENDFSLDSCPPAMKVAPLENVTKITALFVITIASLVGNILVITVSRRNRNLQTIAYSFVVNMAIADLMTTVINMPESIIVEIRNTDQWFPGKMGVAMCKFWPFLQQVCAFCSVLSLLAISLDRYFAICLPFRRIMSKKLSRVIILLTWLLPVVSSAPMLVANNVVEISGELLCLETWPSPFDPIKVPTDYTIILFALFYVLPSTVISFLYSLVIFKIWRRRVPGNRSTVTTEAYSRSRRKALKVFISIVVCFALCWLPYHVTFFLLSYNEIYFYCGLPRDIDFIAVFFSHSISAFNPCIYLILNKEYRTGSERLFYSCCCKDSSTFYPERSTGTAGHSRIGASELCAQTSVSIKSPRVHIARFRRRRVDPYQEDLSRGDAFVIPCRSARAELESENCRIEMHRPTAKGHIVSYVK